MFDRESLRKANFTFIDLNLAISFLQSSILPRSFPEVSSAVSTRSPALVRRSPDTINDNKSNVDTICHTSVQLQRLKGKGHAYLDIDDATVMR